ncbi:diguanylate cyclase (GGDEF) domain-containing protein [Devosia lucknowensis]|uniref:diguanylate cyclase n=1 Tax=Devosia lucknowensis TaxID=1096929 RepID=A0A1Y6EPA9_9HYPH|nr:GGDEF domain-containing protein [Devosia lucknowensis]SMQ64129.1 diguanylate cyclase (GGDEF) domain-containing protein [Devosia lucknowensis]
MSDQFYLALLNPIIALSFSIVVALLWHRWPRHTHFFPLSVAFLYAGLAFITQEWALFSAPGGINYAGNALFFAAVILACVSALLRVKAKVPLWGYGIITVFSLCGFLYFSLVAPSTISRIVLMNCSFIGLSVLTITRMAGAGVRSRADQLFVAVVALGGAISVIRLVMALSGMLPLNSAGGVDRSAYWSSVSGLTPLLSIFIVAVFVFALALEIVADLRQQADHDHLTGLLNRRGFETAASTAMNASRTDGALMIADIDDFKQVNDQFGHAIGDNVIEAVGRALREHGQADFVGRIGGEEFALFFRRASASQLQDIAGAAAAALDMRHIPGLPPGYKLTISIGLHHRQGGETLDQMLVMADRALYRAKASGKNRAVMSPARLKLV